MNYLDYLYGSPYQRQPTVGTPAGAGVSPGGSVMAPGNAGFVGGSPSMPQASLFGGPGQSGQGQSGGDQGLMLLAKALMGRKNGPPSQKQTAENAQIANAFLSGPSAANALAAFQPPSPGTD